MTPESEKAPEKTCLSEEKHEQHICSLHKKGLTQLVQQLTDNPTVTCAICLVNANSPDNVCSPTTLGEIFNYSDMRGSKKIICETVNSDVKKDTE